jgi:hypothetical protein
MVSVCVRVYLISSSLRVASSSSCISFFVSSRAVRGRVGVCAGRPRAVSLSVSLASDSASEPRSCSSTSTTSAETENDAHHYATHARTDMHKLRPPTFLLDKSDGPPLRPRWIIKNPHLYIPA